MSISAETHTPVPANAAGTPRQSRSRRAHRPAASDHDGELVAQAQGGDAAAYGRLYQRYHQYIRKMLNDDVHDVEARNDLLQTAFERGWSKLRGLRNPDAFRPWLAQLTRRLIIDHYRTSSRHVATDFTDPDEQLEIESRDWSAHDWAAMRELASAVKNCIDGLAPRDAAVLELATSFGFTSQETAAALDIDVSHARVLLHRARRRLSRELVATYEEPMDEPAVQHHDHEQRRKFHHPRDQHPRERWS